jgi:hypothetical protein
LQKINFDFKLKCFERKQTIARYVHNQLLAEKLLK